MNRLEKLALFGILVGLMLALDPQAGTLERGFAVLFVVFSGIIFVRGTLRRDDDDY